MAIERFFKAAGFTFTWRVLPSGRCRVDMHREDASGRLHWVTFGESAAGREALYAAALALVAWVASLEVGPRRDPKAQAVAESLAVLCDRMRQTEAHGRPAERLMLAQMLGARGAAA